MYSNCDVCVCVCKFFYKYWVDKLVETNLLNIELRSLINAANMTDMIKPFNGDGINPNTKRGYAVFVQLYLLPQ